MLKKMCKCGKVIPINFKKCAECATKDNAYDNGNEDKQIYRSKQWTKLSALCKDNCIGVDIYQYFVYGKVVVGKVAHHIIPVKDNASRAFDVENLIWLSADSHAEIHKLYNMGKQEKINTQAALFMMLKRWETEAL